MWVISLTLSFAVGLLHLRGCTAELKLVQVMFRHANRYPDVSASVYPNDPYINNTYKPEGLGALTNTGKLEAYKYGQFLRERYGKFLGAIYSPNIIRYYADEFDRIMMTAELAAAAMFPPTNNKEQRWHPHLNWQPIPVWTEPIETDVLYIGLLCSRHTELRGKIENTDPYLVKRQRRHQSFFDYLSKHAGSNVTQWEGFFLYETLHFQYDIGLKLPAWTKPIFPDGPFESFAAYDFVIQSYTKEMQKLLGGMWLREWLKRVDEFLNSKAPLKRKAHIYAGHLTNIGNTLVALKNFDYRMPGFSSSIMFELHEENNKLYVKILHRDRGIVRVLEVPGCGGKLCPLEVFRKVVAPVVPDDPQKLCGTLVLGTQ